ncbi:MAG TPA: FAD-dependent oxidoreductase, partial [Pseudonocardiaceae bacterium]|nr:FAD-dependent oxidoreductase [Pseudonocardiaceae bacterium]
LHNAKERMMPTLDLSDIPEPLDYLALAFGFRCRSGAVIVDDDDPAPAEDPTMPTGRPGFRAPHVSVVVGDTGMSTVDLFGSGWVLIAADEGWQRATVDTPVRCYRLGADLSDPTGRLADTYGIGTFGASLVRPDGVVAWRTDTLPADPTDTLTSVLDRVLARV